MGSAVVTVKTALGPNFLITVLYANLQHGLLSRESPMGQTLYGDLCPILGMGI